MTNQEFTKHLKSNELNIIIFGYGYLGKKIANILIEQNMSIDCFCDNSDEYISENFYGIPVISFKDTIYRNNKNPIFIVSVYNKADQQNIYSNIEKIGFKNYEIYDVDYFFSNIETTNYKVLCEKFDFNALTIRLEKDLLENTTYLYSYLIELIVTERCSLKCKDCSHFMQYYEDPMHYKKEDLFSYIDAMDNIFDSVERIDIVGGETLLHPDIYEVLAYAQTKSTWKYVFLITNGTILPDKKDLLKLDTSRLGFMLSDYGKLSKNRTKLIELLDELNIIYYLCPFEQWRDMAHIEYRNKTIPQLIKTYKECEHQNITIINGNLFSCIHLGSTYQLKAVPQKEIYCIDIMNKNKDVSVIKKEVKQLLYFTEYLDGCNWCRGRTKSENSAIPIAIQTPQILSYKKYDYL